MSLKRHNSSCFDGSEEKALQKHIILRNANTNYAINHDIKDQFLIKSAGKKALQKHVIVKYKGKLCKQS